MIRHCFSLLGLFIAAGCGGSDATSCPVLDGSYRQTFTERSGTCGPISETVVQYEDGAVLLATEVECETLNESLSEDLCTLDAANECVSADGARIRTVLHTTANSDSSRLTGTATIRVEYAGNSCESTYRYVLERL